MLVGIRLPSNRYRFAFTARVLALAMAFDALIAVRAPAAPGDVFSIAAPAIGSEPPKAASIASGDAAVSTQTGQLSYGYPIQLPPGRGGMRPSLALAYSSQAPIYGGVANGWSIGVPMITVDTTQGRLREQSYSATKIYSSSMAGGRPLIPAHDSVDTDVAAVFKAQWDGTFTRYEQIANPSTSMPYWRARSTDGITYSFGQRDHASSCTIISDEYAPLTSMQDAFGNRVTYNYTAGIDGECLLSGITWGANDAAGVADFAMVSFAYSVTSSTDCPSGMLIGHQTSYRSGAKIVTGASEIDTITITAFPPGLPSAPVHTRVITLSYQAPSGVEQTATCAAKHAAYRTLYSIQESAWITGQPHVDLPAVKFTYGSAQFGTGTLAWQTSQPTQPPWGTLNYSYNLGWGYRWGPLTDNQRWPSVEAMMIDVDGDGLLDRVYNFPQNDGNGNLTCGATWSKNMGNLTFASQPGRIALPTLKWANNDRCSYVGNTGPTTGADNTTEGCALNYQRTRYVNSTNGRIDLCPADSSSCPGRIDVDQVFSCPWGTASAGMDCGKAPSTGPMNLAYRWMDYDGDGLVDIVASPSSGSVYNLEMGTGIADCTGTVPVEPNPFGTSGFPICPFASYTSDTHGGYTMCNGMYPWAIFRGRGSGQFGSSSDLYHPVADAIVYQPMPLETDAGDSSMLSAPVGANSGTLDVDGDGHADGVFRRAGAATWDVWRYKFTPPAVVGSLTPAFDDVPFSMTPGGTDLQLNQTATEHPANTNVNYPASVDGFFDFTGDGLVDRWHTDQQFQQFMSTWLYMNSGATFTNQPSIQMSVRPANDGFVCPHGECTPSGSTTPTGSRYDINRTLDLDLDGRSDIVQFPLDAFGFPTIAPTATLNQGGAFASSVGAVPGFGPLSHAVVSQQNNSLYMWEVRSDLLDLDGDGIPEGIDFGDSLGLSTAMTLSRIPTPPQPPRLLVSIDNGRGAVTTASYAAMSNNSVVLPPDSGHYMPHTQWVVQSVTTTDNVPVTSSTVTTTSYTYKNPHFGPDDQFRWAFRGFEEVTTTAQSGAKTVQRYDYTVDQTGRLKTSLVIPAEAPSEVRSIDESTWVPEFSACNAFGLGCNVTTYHATRVDHWTCKNGQDETACRAHTDTFTSTRSTLTAFGGEYKKLWKETSARLTTSNDESQHDGDRITDATFIFVDDATNYRMLPESATNSVITGGAPVMFAKTAHTYNTDAPANTVALTDKVWFDNAQTPRIAVTRRSYDMQTGNVLTRMKPNQNNVPGEGTGDGTVASFTYDSRKLFVTTETREIWGPNNPIQYGYEYGTGTKLDTIGPNIAPCYTWQQGCPSGTLGKEDHRIQVDGLGRMIGRYETFMANGGSSYQPVLVETNVFQDAAPSSITHQRAVSGAIDYAGQETYYSQDRTDLDGHGRPIKRTVSHTGHLLGASGAVDAITTYSYRNDGTLAQVTTPDPTANNTSTVTYTYSFDSLGRPTSIRRPDSSADPSGVDMSYDGLLATSQEHVGAGGGTAAVTKTTKDAFGRLVQVDELASGSSTFATTYYQYDAADNVFSVQDPEGVTTQLAHDFAGHRTQITRYGRLWTYGYDLDGNVISQVVPGYASDQHDIANYTTTVVYDDLDRPTSKMFGPRMLSNADQALFGAASEVFTYDAGDGHNATGQLWTWKTYGPGSNVAMLVQAPTHNAQGFIQLDHQETGGIAGLPALQRNVNFGYTVGGAQSAVYCGDAVGAGTVFTYAETHVDAKGLPTSFVVLVDAYAEQLPYFYITNTRNVAGLVTREQPSGPYYGAPGTGGWPIIESDYAFDKLGRLTSEYDLDAGATVARQDFQYNGNDDPKQLDTYLGTNHKTFSYGFDARHQLTTASEANPSYFAASYGYGTAGRFTSANENAAANPGSDVTNRNVTYSYTPPSGVTRAADPEQVWSLNTNVSQLASYDYDAAGNQVVHCMGAMTYGATPDADSCSGESLRFVYDGKDQLRRATHYSQGGAITGSEEYWYGRSGERMIALKRDAQGNKTELIWWIDNVEAHYDATGTVTHVYSYLHFGGTTVRVDRTADTTVHVEYELAGVGGGALAAVDQATGAVNSTVSYAPFGEIIEAIDGGGLEGLGSHRRHWNDKYVDEVSDLAYYGARYYDKTLMGWTQDDPLYRFAPDARWTAPRRGNLYAFSLNNPLRYADPDGLEAGNQIDAIVESNPDAAHFAAEGAHQAEAGDGGTQCQKGQGGCEGQADVVPTGPVSGSVNMWGIPSGAVFDHAPGAPGVPDPTDAPTPIDDPGIPYIDEHQGPQIGDLVTMGLVLGWALPVAVAKVVGGGAAAPDNREGGAVFGAGCAAGCASHSEASASESSTTTLHGTNEPGQVTSRGSWRKATVDNAWSEAAAGPTDGKLCPTCGKEVKVAPGSGPRDWDLNHDPAWTKRVFPSDVTRKQVLDNYQEGVWLECPTCNRGAGNRR